VTVATVAPLVLAPLLAPGTGTRTNEVLGVLIVVAYAGHLPVTGWLWTLADVRATVRARRVRLVVVPASLVVVAALAGRVLSPRLLEWLLVGFFAWQFTHFQRQNLGLVALVAAKWNSPSPTTFERRLVAVAGWCATAGLIARPGLLGLPGLVSSSAITATLVHTAAVGFLTCTVAALITAAVSGRPAPARAAHLGAVLFMAPVFLFTAPDAAVAGMVIAHGLQYLWVVGWRCRAARRPDAIGTWQGVLCLSALAVVGGALLEAMSELHAARVPGLRVLYGAYLGIVMAHFAIDGVVWRRPAGPTQPVAPSPVLLPSGAHGRR
jgi:hypothetical protein